MEGIMTPRVKPLAKRVVRGNRGVKVTKSCTIYRSPDEVYQYWRQLENLPKIMPNLRSVTQTSAVDSHWVMEGPGGKTIEWDAVIFNEHPNELIAWRTRQHSKIAHAGSVRFRPALTGEGTEVTVSLEYNPPAGKLGNWVVKIFGKDPAQQLQEDLARFKLLMEAGEIPTTRGQPNGPSPRRSGAGEQS
jgi:uncharacterized membrane protein